MVFNTNILAGSGGQGDDAFSPVGLQIKNSSSDQNNYLHFLASVNATVSSPFSLKAPNGKKMSLVIWFYPTENYAKNMHIMGSGAGTDPQNLAVPYTFFVRTDDGPPASTINLLWQKAAGGFGINTAEPVFVANEWNCMMISFNTSISDKSIRWYRNDADQGATNANDAVYRFGGGAGESRQFVVASKGINQQAFGGALAEIYYAPNQFIDFDVESNRRLFLNADGTPVDLGADGSTPTGIQPMLYLSLREGEGADQFAVNRGFGADLSVVGNVSIFADAVSCSIA